MKCQWGFVLIRLFPHHRSPARLRASLVKRSLRDLRFYLFFVFRSFSLSFSSSFCLSVSHFLSSFRSFSILLTLFFLFYLSYSPSCSLGICKNVASLDRIISKLSSSRSLYPSEERCISQKRTRTLPFVLWKVPEGLPDENVNYLLKYYKFIVVVKLLVLLWPTTVVVPCSKQTRRSFSEMRLCSTWRAHPIGRKYCRIIIDKHGKRA